MIFWGYRYFVLGEVVYGRQLGRTWGTLATINQVPEDGKLLPPFGVYASKNVYQREKHSTESPMSV